MQKQHSRDLKTDLKLARDYADRAAAFNRTNNVNQEVATWIHAKSVADGFSPDVYIGLLQGNGCEIDRLVVLTLLRDMFSKDLQADKPTSELVQQHFDEIKNLLSHAKAGQRERPKDMLA